MSKFKRYFSQDKLERFLKDFDFLFGTVRKSCGELDLKLRNNYFNLYYKGNSLSKVSFEGENYKVVIHNKFLYNKEYVFEKDKRFRDLGQPGDNYTSYLLTRELLPAFFQTKNLNRIYSRISKVNYSEEITFEQILITDNLKRQDFFIIDRQITETLLKRKRLDLLALKQVGKNENKYYFLVIEIKLGNNPELQKEVGEQLSNYIEHINKNFDSWKNCYEENYRQIKKTGIFDIPEFPEIEIVNDTHGLVVVGGYSGMAKESIRKFNRSYPNIKVKQIRNLL